MKIYHTETQERLITAIVADNIKRHMELNDIPKIRLERAIGITTLRNLLEQRTLNGCTIVTLQKTAATLKVKTIYLVEDWED